ncbi:MAG TPA: penicillin-binding transpeptidase domain-containing protein, partial [Nitrospiria bacterium]|nr:penicillin-binding transpeptidase domain-containing protein [Nitrospiria bacterium]
EEHEPMVQEAISRETAYIVTNMMEDVVQRGTARSAKSIGRALAGKTGTTNDFTDAWFVGFSPNLAAGAWVGFDQVRPLGNKESGSRAALPIWISFMKEALEMIPSMNFKIPENIVYAKIDPKTGLLAGEGSDEGVVEIFVQGRQPEQTSRPVTKPAGFFRIDAADGKVF